MKKLIISNKSLDTVWLRTVDNKERLKITAPGLGEKLKNFKEGSVVEVKFE
jgi:hypothetical protein